MKEREYMKTVNEGDVFLDGERRQRERKYMRVGEST